MLFNSVPSCTLYAKVSLKRTPYANTIVAIRIVADTYATFTSNKAQFLVDLSPENTTLEQLELVLANLKTKANAAEVVVKMQPAVSKYLVK